MQTEILALEVLDLNHIRAHIEEHQLTGNEAQRVIYIRQVIASLRTHLDNQDTREQALPLIHDFLGQAVNPPISFPATNRKKGSPFDQLEMAYLQYVPKPEPVVVTPPAPVTRVSAVPVTAEPDDDWETSPDLVDKPTGQAPTQSNPVESRNFFQEGLIRLVFGVNNDPTPVLTRPTINTSQRIQETLNNLGRGQQRTRPTTPDPKPESENERLSVVEDDAPINVDAINTGEIPTTEVSQDPVNEPILNPAAPIAKVIYRDLNGNELPDLTCTGLASAEVVMGVYQALFEAHSNEHEALNPEELNYCVRTAQWLDDTAKASGWTPLQLTALHVWANAFTTLEQTSRREFSQQTQPEQVQSSVVQTKNPSKAKSPFSVIDKKNQRLHVLAMSRLSYLFSTPAGKVISAVLIAAIAIGLSFATFGAAPAALALAGVFALLSSLAVQFLFRKEKIAFEPSLNHHAQFMARLGRLMPQSNLAKFFTGLGFIALVGITIAVAVALPPVLTLLPGQIALAGVGLGLITASWPLLVRGAEKAIATIRHPKGSPIKRIGAGTAYERCENYDLQGQWQVRDIRFEKNQSWLCNFGAIPRKQNAEIAQRNSVVPTEAKRLSLKG